MEKEFLSYERALKLKKLGFDKPCFGYYQSTKLKLQLPLIKSETQVQNYMLEEDCSAPTFQQAFSWFREKYDLHYLLMPHYSFEGEPTVNYYIAQAGPTPFIQVKTFEEAELACLDKLIEFVEKR